jgi:hypothetical protein
MLKNAQKPYIPNSAFSPNSLNVFSQAPVFSPTPIAEVNYTTKGMGLSREKMIFFIIGPLRVYQMLI